MLGTKGGLIAQRDLFQSTIPSNRVSALLWYVHKSIILWWILAGSEHLNILFLNISLIKWTLFVHCYNMKYEYSSNWARMKREQHFIIRSINAIQRNRWVYMGSIKNCPWHWQHFKDQGFLYVGTRRNQSRLSRQWTLLLSDYVEPLRMTPLLPHWRLVLNICIMREDELFSHNYHNWQTWLVISTQENTYSLVSFYDA